MKWKDGTKVVEKAKPESNGSPPADLKLAKRKKVSAADCPTNRTPPFSQEAEQGVLGCCLLDSRKCPDEVERFGIGADDFYDLRHREIYEAVSALSDGGEPLDIITLQQKLADRHRLDEVGGIAYLNVLLDGVPSAANLSYYAEIMLEKSSQRRLIAECTDLVALSYKHSGSEDDLMDEAERRIMALRRRRPVQACIKKVVAAALVAIEEKWAKRGVVRGLSTGFPDLDRVLDGLCPTDLVVPAAFPSMGKTSLSMNFVEHVVLGMSVPAAVFSLEMTAEQLAVRMLSSRAKVNMRRVHEMGELEFGNLRAAADLLAASGLHIVDDADEVGAICAEARRLVREHGVKLVVVDYLQLILGKRSHRDDNREREVAEVGAAFKRLAKELRVPVVLPSQLNDDGRLRESRATGQHADVVLKILSDMPEGEEQSHIDSEPVTVLVEKNRNGPRNVKVPLTFLKCFTRFESAAKVGDEDMPQ